MRLNTSISYLRELAKEQLSNFDLFSSKNYIEMFPEAAATGVDVYRHALEYAAEGHSIFFTPAVVKKLAKIQPTADPEPLELQAGIVRDDVNLLISTRGNIFMNEIADRLAHDIQSLGARAAFVHETDAVESVDPKSCIVVAPHEFFTLGQGRNWLTEDFVTQCVVFNVEQPQTPWFSAGLLPLLLARGVIDLCPQMTTIWRNMGKSSMHYEPSVNPSVGAQLSPHDRGHPLIAALPPNACQFHHQTFTKRPLDLCFFGSRSLRRDVFFARYAARFSAYNTFIYFRQRPSGPIRATSSEKGLTRVADFVASLSKLCLNIHRDDVPYFEWHRMVKHGMASGSVVVSDTCLPHPFFNPNENFLQEETRHLPNIVDWVLNTPDGRAAGEKILANNLNKLRDPWRRRAQVIALLRFLNELRRGDLV